jgi:hypothetical protein
MLVQLLSLAIRLHPWGRSRPDKFVRDFFARFSAYCGAEPERHRYKRAHPARYG